MVADLEHIAGVMQAAPRHIRDVKQAVDTADINERTVFGEVLDRAFDYVSNIDTAQRLALLCSHYLVGNYLAGKDDVVTATAEFDDLGFDLLALVLVKAVDRA